MGESSFYQLLLGTSIVTLILMVMQLVSAPDWYTHIAGKPEFAEIVEYVLEHDLAPLGTEATIDWDAERLPIDTIVVHHTALPPGITPERLSALHLLTVYAPYFTNPAASENVIKGAPIYSGHWRRGGTQTFVGYHWIIRQDGSAHKLLPDSALGWHAGNWGINQRSIGIVFDGDFSKKRPSKEMIEMFQFLRRWFYKEVSDERIFGHSEVRKGAPTLCPGGTFIKDWKKRLLTPQ